MSLAFTIFASFTDSCLKSLFYQIWRIFFVWAFNFYCFICILGYNLKCNFLSVITNNIVVVFQFLLSILEKSPMQNYNYNRILFLLYILELPHRGKVFDRRKCRKSLEQQRKLPIGFIRRRQRIVSKLGCKFLFFFTVYKSKNSFLFYRKRKHTSWV